MIKRKIKISGFNDLSEFIEFARLTEGDIFVHKGKYTVNGKSLLGMLSIDVSDGAEIEFPRNAAAFNLYLDKFAV